MDGEFAHTVEKFVLAAVASSPGGPPSGFDKVRNVHRLDYATSGVVLMALQKVSAAIAAEQFERRTVRKSYTALLHGHLRPSSCDDHARAQVDDTGRIRWTWSIADGEGFAMVVGTQENPGRPCVTSVQVVAYGTYHGKPVTKVRLFPETGRRHQLRIHAAAAGVPIVGDATYIEDEGMTYFDDSSFVVPRMMLHAQRLALLLPPASAIVHGKKSARGILVPRVFSANDPFEDLADLSLSPLADDEQTHSSQPVDETERVQGANIEAPCIGSSSRVCNVG